MFGTMTMVSTAQLRSKFFQLDSCSTLRQKSAARFEDALSMLTRAQKIISAMKRKTRSLKRVSSHCKSQQLRAPS